MPTQVSMKMLLLLLIPATAFQVPGTTGRLLVRRHAEQPPARLELPYDDDSEALLKTWMDRAQELSNVHDESGYYFKGLHRKFDLPPILLNLFLAPASVLLGNVHLPLLDRTLQVSLGTLVSSLLTLTAGLLAGIATFNDADQKSSKHFDISARYVFFYVGDRS